MPTVIVVAVLVVIVALAVNYYLPREKVVPLWEGVKARISGKSAK